MADFIETNNTKTATRTLAAPIENVSVFESVINGILTNNPFECVDYVSGGQSLPGVSKSKESYTAKFLFEDDDAKSVGAVSLKAPSVNAYNDGAANVLADTALAGIIGGDCIRDLDNDSYSCTLKCMDANGELYYVSFTRKSVKISSYADDAIRTKIEAWADTIPALA
ncbi:MAG: hypothetical protein PHO78_07675 [Methanomicrobium sp.]|nr:hypothetical protein [Methanomicrobium sp.]